MMAVLLALCATHAVAQDVDEDLLVEDLLEEVDEDVEVWVDRLPDDMAPDDLQWQYFQDWLTELSPEERSLLSELGEWEGLIDSAFLDRMRDELELADGWDRNHVVLHFGFEAGTVTGLRMQAGMEWGSPLIGLRLGAHTWQRSEVALQPMALGYLDIPIGEVHLVGSYGRTRRDNVWGPAGGAALAWAPWEPLIQMQAGLLWGPGFRSIDVSYAWMW